MESEIGIQRRRMLNFGSLLPRKADRRAQRERWTVDMADVAMYAVGDVHGCLAELKALEEEIRRDAARLPGEKLIIMLGDYIDRGPASAEVIEHLMGPPPDGLYRVCLTGNHEMAMLDYLEGRIGREDWTRLGGDRTLFSYGIDHQHLAQVAGEDAGRYDAMIRDIVPKTHVAFLKSLPVLVESPAYLFVHAGIRPDVPLADQSDGDLTTIRSEFFAKAHLLDRFVVHGHTPTTTVRLEGRRLNVDSGCYFSGRLTAVRIWRDTGKFLTNLGSGGEGAMQ